ncbi:1920_t:CDS:1, partial [Entrophospora sp. SA101]
KELSEEIQLIRRHMKKDYENEIRINIGENGELKHDKYLDHCLLYAF